MIRLVSPAVRVVIPANNAQAFLAETLQALVEQHDPPPLEVVVVVSASTDDTEHVAASFAEKIPLKLLRSDLPGGNVARNIGAAASNPPPVLLFLDHDDVPEPNWVSAMTSGLDEADVVLGRYAVDRLNSVATLAMRGDVAFTQAPDEYDPRSLTGQGGNSGYRTSTWVALRGLDVDQQFVDDVEILWRAHDAGFHIRYTPDAVVQYRLRADARSYFEQYVHRYQGWAYLHRHHPDRVPRRRLGAAVKQWGWVVIHLRRAWSGDPAVRGTWLRPAARVVGSLTGSIKAWTFYP